MAQPEPAPVERRGTARMAVAFPITLERVDTIAIETEAVNISASGMLVRSPVELPLWASFTALLPDAGQHDLRVVRRDGATYGCLFRIALETGELEAVLASEAAAAGFERLRAELEAPQPARPRGLLRLWRR